MTGGRGPLNRAMEGVGGPGGYAFSKKQEVESGQNWALPSGRSVVSASLFILSRSVRVILTETIQH